MVLMSLSVLHYDAYFLYLYTVYSVVAVLGVVFVWYQTFNIPEDHAFIYTQSLRSAIFISWEIFESPTK